MANKQDLVNTAYGYFSQGEPFPVDLEMKLSQAGIDPDELCNQFEQHEEPADVLDNEI